jgi:hypothetical protein
MSPCGMIFTPLEPATGIIATENSMKKQQIMTAKSCISRLLSTLGYSQIDSRHGGSQEER